VTQYVWDQSYIDTPVVRFRDATGSGTYAPLYYTTDADHDVTAVADGAGVVQERYVYDAYGNVTFRDESWALLTTGGNNSSSTPGVSSAFDNQILYCGYRYDPETAVAVGTTFAAANYQVRAREYITQLSAFGSRDPIASSPNLYEYCGDDPLDATDPMGLWPFVGPTGPIFLPMPMPGPASPPVSGNVAGGCGTFKVNMVPNGRNFSTGVQGTVTFSPSPGCPICNSIRIVQVAKVWDNFGNDLSATVNPELPKFQTKPNGSKGVEGGWFVDADPNICVKGTHPTPGYGGRYDPKLFTPGSNDGKSPTDASIKDWPNFPGRNYTVLFEDCALCEETGVYLGCATWGYSVIDGQVYPEPVQGSKGPSNNFNEAVNRFKKYYE
jgi:RHS repeat-associated protein